MDESLAELLRPKVRHAVRELVEAAGIDVSDWAVDRHGSAIKNPNANLYRSFKWSFGGSGEPVVALCIWHEEIDWSSNPPIRRGNTKQQQDDLNALADSAVSTEVRSRLGIKIRRTRDFQNALYEAYSKRIAVRVILLEGKRTDIGDAATDSSEVKYRELDGVKWYVHVFDPFTGEYTLLRGVEPPPVTREDPFAGIQDPGLDAEFQSFVAELSETERDAVVKARVGQGPFRSALIERWAGCSVTGCRQLDVLVASHIRPWSKCTTPAERLGAANGLLLTPNLDRLFDRGLITFDQKFRIRVCPRLKAGTLSQLNVNSNLRLRSEAARQDMLPFLQWHEDRIYQAA